MSKAKPKTLMDHLRVLGGADLDMLATLPRTSGQFVQMALVLLSTAILASVSMWFALVNGVHIAAWAALPVALFWGFLVLNLDRFLTMSMTGVHSPGKLFALALPRILLAALIGFVVSTPLVLRVFQSDISAAMADYNLKQSQTAADGLSSSTEQKEVDRLAKVVAGYEAILAGDLPAGTSSAGTPDDVAALEKKVSKQQAVVDQAIALEECEREYGRAVYVKRFPGKLKNPEDCSPMSGTDGRYPEIRDNLDRQKKDLKALIKQRDAAVSAKEAADADSQASQAAALAEAQADVQNKIGPARNELVAAQDRLALVVQSQAAVVAADKGLLAQIRGLRLLSEENPDMRLAHWAVAGVFFMVELLPVLVKVLTNLGRPSVYEQALELEQQSWMDEAVDRRNDKRRQIEGEAAKRKALDDDMREREKSLGIKANERVAEEMETLLDEALADWGVQVDQELARRRGGLPPMP